MRKIILNCAPTSCELDALVLVLVWYVAGAKFGYRRDGRPTPSPTPLFLECLDELLPTIRSRSTRAYIEEIGSGPLSFQINISQSIEAGEISDRCQSILHFVSLSFAVSLCRACIQYTLWSV